MLLPLTFSFDFIFSFVVFSFPFISLHDSLILQYNNYCCSLPIPLFLSFQFLSFVLLFYFISFSSQVCSLFCSLNEKLLDSAQLCSSSALLYCSFIYSAMKMVYDHMLFFTLFPCLVPYSLFFPSLFPFLLFFIS